jgi:serine protease Do
VIVDVGYGSPAARTGVCAGDVLAGVSRVKDAAALLTGPVGKQVSLSLRRNGQPVKAQFQLEDYP